MDEWIGRVVGPNTAWLVLAVLWSLNGPTERNLMRHFSPAVYSKAKALAVGATYLASPVSWDETLAIFQYPAMWILFAVSLVNTPLNAYIIKHGRPAIQLPLAQVLSNLIRALWWSLLLSKPLTTKQYIGIFLAAVSCVLLRD